VSGADNLTTFMCQLSWKSGSLNLLEPSGSHRACYGTPLTLPFFMKMYSTRRWLYIAETCSCSLPIDKVVFRLDVQSSSSSQETGMISMLDVHTRGVRGPSIFNLHVGTVACLTQRSIVHEYRIYPTFCTGCIALLTIQYMHKCDR